MSLVNPTDVLRNAVTAFAARKIAYTGRLQKLVQDFNSGKAVTAADLNDLIATFYNPMTLASNDLRAEIAKVLAGVPNEVDQFTAFFGSLLNLLCGLTNQDQALDVITKLAANLENETATWFYYQTPTIDQANFSAMEAFAGYKGLPPTDLSQYQAPPAATP